jgi:hypothetical protein
MAQTNRGDRPRVLIVGGDPVAAVVVRLNDPRNRPAFSGLGVRTVCSATNVGEALGEAYARAADPGE